MAELPDRIPISQATLVFQGWVRGTEEYLALYLVEAEGAGRGYLTLSPLHDTLWIREFYLDGRPWRGKPSADRPPLFHRGLGKLILAYFEDYARRHHKSLGIFTTRSLGLLKACDRVFGDRCQYHVTVGDPPQTLFRQHGLRWLPFIEQYSVLVPPHQVAVFQKVDDGFQGDPGQPYRLFSDPNGTLQLRDEETGKILGPRDGLLVSIGPSVDILVSR